MVQSPRRTLSGDSAFFVFLSFAMCATLVIALAYLCIETYWAHCVDNDKTSLSNLAIVVTEFDNDTLHYPIGDHKALSEEEQNPGGILWNPNANGLPPKSTWIYLNYAPRTMYGNLFLYTSRKDGYVIDDPETYPSQRLSDLPRLDGPELCGHSCTRMGYDSDKGLFGK